MTKFTEGQVVRVLAADVAILNTGSARPFDPIEVEIVETEENVLWVCLATDALGERVTCVTDDRVLTEYNPATDPAQLCFFPRENQGVPNE